jgi:hypothetical protein
MEPMASDRIFRLPAAGALILVFALSTLTWTDTDLWGHTRFGLDILRDHELPSDDPYSFTQDKPWVNHEWLSELQMGLAYAAGGPTGLALLKGTLTFIALVLMWGTLRGVDVAPRIVIFAIAAMSTVPVTRTLRPQAWSLMLLVMLCRILIEDRQRLRWVIPVLLAIWANLHGGWIVGFGILVVWTICDLVTWGRGDSSVSPQTAVAVAALSGLATLATPYGWELWEFLLETVRMGRDITEWRPLWRQPPPDWVPWIVAVAIAIWCLRRPQRYRLHVAGVIAMLAFSSARVMRIAPLFVACATVLLSPWFRARFPARAGRLPAVAPTGARGLPAVAPAGAKAGDQRMAAAGLFVAALVAAAFVGSKSLTCVRTEGTWIPDAEAASVLEHAPPGRLVTFFNWGEYALWHFGPRLRVSMDGRRETVYTDTRLLEHDAIVRGTDLAFPTLAGWNAEYVWLPTRSSATRAWLLANGYRLEKETPRSFVAVRKDLPVLTGATEHSPQGPTCFPD